MVPHKAVEQSDAEAQYNLGLMYRDGRGVPQDEEVAEMWKRKAAEEGYKVSESSPGWFGKVAGFFKNK